MATSDLTKSTEKMIKSMKCPYIGKLVQAVYVSNCKILQTVTKSRGKLPSHPTTLKFFEQCILECGRLLWQYPFLFTKSDPITTQKYWLTADTIIQEGIRLAVKNILPFSEILEDESDDDEEESVLIPVDEIA
jgi:hypothetical protein